MISRLKMMAIAVAAVFTVVGCADKTKFTITGQTDSLATGTVKIMLLDPENGLTEFITDSIVNNKFKIQGAVEQPVLAFLFLDKRSPVADFMLETGVKYKINVAGDNVTVESDSKEDFLNKQLKELQNPDQFQQLYVDLRAAHSANDEAKVTELVARIKSLGTEIKDKQIELIHNNPTLTAPAFRLFVNKNDRHQELEFADIKREFDAMGDAARNTAVGQNIAGYIARVEAVAVGQPAPDFTALTPDGTELKLSDVKAKVKILDFWASWCTPCRMLNPDMVQLYKDYKSKGLEVLGFSLDDNADNWKNAIKEDGLNWLHASDLKGWKSEVAQLYVINAIPSVFVIDENNIIVGTPHMPEEVRALVETLLGK